MAEIDERFEAVDLEAWRQKAGAALKGRELEDLRWRSLDGVTIDPLYVETDAARGAPGAPPFVRGSEPAGAGGRDWQLVHEARGADRAALRGNAARALTEGADAIWIDANGARLLDADDLRALRELGAPVFVEAGATALGAAWLAAPSTEVTVLSDPLGTLAVEGALPTSLERAFADLAELSAAAGRARPILVSSRPYHEGGAGAVDELALSIASGVAYLRGLSEAGQPLAELPRRMRFELALDADFFVGLAKLRAARLLWSKVLRTLGVDGPEQGMRMRARASRRMQTALDPQLGVLRGTAAGFAAIVGGAEQITLAPYDALLASADPHADRLARTTQLVMRHEAHLGRVLDPAGGSYFLEALTDDLARRAWAAMQEIEQLGGLPRGLADGSVADRVRAGADERRRAIATGAQGMVAVNRYPSPGGPADLGAERAPEGGDAGGERAVAIAPMRDAEPFEILRRRAAALPAERRRAVVLGVGEPGALRPRMEYARETLGLLGLDVELHPARATLAEALADVGELAGVAAPCASDEDYPELALEALPALRERGARAVVLATRPGGGLRADGFVHRGVDLAAALGAILDTLEAS